MTQSRVNLLRRSHSHPRTTSRLSIESGRGTWSLEDEDEDGWMTSTESPVPDLVRISRPQTQSRREKSPPEPALGNTETLSERRAHLAIIFHHD